MNMYALGVPTSVVVDDYLVTYGSTYFSHPGQDKSLWGPLYEKILAKFLGNYMHMHGGSAVDAVRNIINAPKIMYQEHKDISVDDLWDALKKHDLAHDIITAGSPDGDDSMTSAAGIVQDHAYVVLGVVELSTGDRLVRLRNPWASEMYIGDWSDDSNKWTSELRNEAGSTQADDGIFFMSVDDYHKEFDRTMVNKNMDGVHQDYFLMLGDDGSKASAGEPYFPYLEGNTAHKLTITSSVDQKVRVMTNVWGDRSFPYSCRNYHKTPHIAWYPWQEMG